MHSSYCTRIYIIAKCIVLTFDKNILKLLLPTQIQDAQETYTHLNSETSVFVCFDLESIVVGSANLSPIKYRSAKRSQEET